MANNRHFIPHLHAFRGFAIISIVGAHAWSFMIFWTGDLSSTGLKWLFALTETVFHGSTLYFAIISGLLFSKILSVKGWSRFYTSKVTNVLLPYTLVTFLLTALYWQYALQDPLINNTTIDYLKVASLNLLTGKGSIHFWYIPVLVVMFLATPFLSWLKGKSHIATCLLILMPLIISRSPFPDFLKPQSFAFFIGAYALGMVIGEHYDKLIQLTNKYLKPLITLVTISTLSIFLLYLNDYKPDGFYSLRQTLIYLQKVSICLLVLHWFYHKESALPQWLSTLGSYAFAIFFLHVIFIDLVISSVRTIASTYRTAEVIALLGSLNLSVAVIGSVLLASIIKKCFGRHSRKVIGV